MAAIVTGWSPARLITSARAETDAKSSRATSSDWAGTSNRTRRPVSSVQSVASSGAPGFWNVNAYVLTSTTRFAVSMRWLLLAVCLTTISACGAT